MRNMSEFSKTILRLEGGDLALHIENKVRSGDVSDLDGTVVLEYDD